MTPAERDAIRAHAVAKLRTCSGSECSVECRAYHAILRYVPPGDAADSSIVPYAAGRDAWIAMHLTGSAKPDAARRLAHALHAAADAAEENDR